MEDHPTASKLIFVYNADSGLFNTVADIAHKILSPSTYSCQLCALTHSYFSVKDEWKDFLLEIETPMEFLHKNEFEEKYQHLKCDYPALLLSSDKGLEVLVSADALNQCNSLEELKTLITEVYHSVQAPVSSTGNK